MRSIPAHCPTYEDYLYALSKHVLKISDRWEISNCGKYWKRIHVAPRQELFTPISSDSSHPTDGPDPDILMDTRLTKIDRS